MLQSHKLKKAHSHIYYSAKNADIALAIEAYFMSLYSGAKSMNQGTDLMNMINSPGLKRLFWWY